MLISVINTMDIEYLKKSVGKHLSRAMAEVAIRQPERPIEFLAYYLITLHERDLQLQKMKQSKSHIPKKQSEPLNDVRSDTEEIVASVLEDLVEQSDRKKSNSQISMKQSETLSDVRSNTEIAVASVLEDLVEQSDRKKSNSQLLKKQFEILSDVRSNSDEIVASILDDLVEQSAELYDPLVTETFSDVDESMLVDIDTSGEHKPHQELVIGTNTALDQKFSKMAVKDSAVSRKEVLVAQPDVEAGVGVYKAHSQRNFDVNLNNNFHSPPAEDDESASD